MKAYNHKKIEQKWQKEWAKTKIYKTLDSSKKPKYYILDMFPYPSGEGLHVGHPKGYIATDIISRMKRMQGFNILHPMGFDAFGLPAENYAIKTKTNPAVSVAKNVARYKKQLEILGFDYDWSREINTTDPKFYKWTQWIFLKLLEKGLAYESYEPINWCPSCKTGLANEDLEDGKCERCGSEIEQKPMRQWVLKITDYAERLLKDLDSLDWPESIKESQRNWIGKSEGAEINFSMVANFLPLRPSSGASGSKRDPRDQKISDHYEIKVFTTRPDTIFGATYVVLAPEHELIKQLQDKIENWNEVEQYIKKSEKKTEIDRIAEGKEKTGVELKGVKAINPATKEEIPIWIADYVLAHYGTGAIMAVPAHDERDFEFAKKYKLPITEVIEPVFIDNTEQSKPKENLPFIERQSVNVIVKHWKENKYLCLQWKKVDWRTFVTGGIETGQTPEEAARMEVQEETGYTDLKFIKEVGRLCSKFYHNPKQINRSAHFHTMYFELQSDTCEETTKEEKEKHEIHWIDYDEVEKFLREEYSLFSWQLLIGKIKIYTGDGLLVNSAQFNGLDSKKAKKEIVKFVGGKMKTTYKLRDWVFSRQRYWGEPIPVLHKDNKVVPVKERDLPVILPKVKSYEPTGTGESPLAGIDKWVNVKGGFKRETNTMPQWAGSSWYYLRFMDPNNSKALVDKKKETYWNQVDFYVGGAEHATRHLIYARFWHKFLYDIGVVSTKEPFKKLQSVGLIIGADGRKMSKRFGNVINPDSIVDIYGADTLRLYGMFMGPFEQIVAWNEDAIVGPRRFLERVWRIGEKVLKQKNSSSLTLPGVPGGTHTVQNSSVSKFLNKTIKKVSEDIENMRFNTAVSSLMIFLNEVENLLKGQTLDPKKGLALSTEDYKKFLQILAPLAPHITDELWSLLGEKKSIHVSDWPKFDPQMIIDDEVKIAIQINGKVRGEAMINIEDSEDQIKDKALKNASVIKYLNDKTPKKVIYIKNRLINIVV